MSRRAAFLLIIAPITIVLCALVLSQVMPLRASYGGERSAQIESIALGDVPAAPTHASAVSSTSPQADEHASPTTDYWSLVFVFVLSTFIGLGVIGGVSRLLHTPLMSLTNAISAIAILGAIVVTGGNYTTQIRILGAIALFASTTNIVSGFLITDRMLKMFKQTRENAKA